MKKNHRDRLLRLTEPDNWPEDRLNRHATSEDIRLLARAIHLLAETLLENENEKSRTPRKRKT